MTRTLARYVVTGVIGTAVFIGGIWVVGAVAFALSPEMGAP